MAAPRIPITSLVTFPSNLPFISRFVAPILIISGREVFSKAGVWFHQLYRSTRSFLLARRWPANSFRERGDVHDFTGFCKLPRLMGSRHYRTMRFDANRFAHLSGGRAETRLMVHSMVQWGDRVILSWDDQF